MNIKVQKKSKEFNHFSLLKNFFGLGLLVSLAVFSADAFAQGKKYAIRKIVIDPGHGGHDSGCKGKFSNEKDVALAISLKVGKLLEENLPDVKIVYTRKTDVFVTLNDRADIANDNKADLFICIHCNAGSKSASGTETYVMGLHKSEDNLRVAQRENAVIIMEDNYQSKYEGFNPNSAEAHIAFSLYQNAFLEQSLTLASKVEREFGIIKREGRGVKQAGFWVLYRTTMPSILIETGFLTHPEEEKYLNSEKGQNEVAYAIFKSIKEYKEETEKKNGSNNTNLKNNISPKNQEEKNLKDTSSTSQNVYYSVQIATASEKKPLELKKAPYSDWENMNTEKTKDGTLKYSVGSLTNYDEAVKLQNGLKEKGFKNAFIIAFKNGERITVNEAKTLLKTKQE